MEKIKNLFINRQNLNNDFIKRTCFVNNIRSKILTVLLVIFAFLVLVYDFVILKKISDFNYFLLNIKADVVLLVFSFIFTLYIFFNQVKTHANIKKHHRYVHGIISLFILLWSAFKAVITFESGIGIYILIIAILIANIIYLFPFFVNLGQLIVTLVFLIYVMLLFNFSFYSIISELLSLSIIMLIVFFTSRYLFYLHIKLLGIESELRITKKNEVYK